MIRKFSWTICYNIVAMVTPIVIIILQNAKEIDTQNFADISTKQNYKLQQFLLVNCVLHATHCTQTLVGVANSITIPRSTDKHLKTSHSTLLRSFNGTFYLRQDKSRQSNYIRENTTWICKTHTCIMIDFHLQRYRQYLYGAAFSCVP